MTTIVAVRKNGRAVIGADTLATLYGTIRQSAAYDAHPGKLLRLGESCLSITGNSSLSLILEDFGSRFPDDVKLDTPLNIFRTALKLHRCLKDDYFVETHDNEDLETSRGRCLIANAHGIFGLYELRSVQEFSRFYSFGSGMDFALGAMHAVYNTLDDPEAIARAGLLAAAEFDNNSAAPFDFQQFDLL